MVGGHASAAGQVADLRGSATCPLCFWGGWLSMVGASGAAWHGLPLKRAVGGAKGVDPASA